MGVDLMGEGGCSFNWSAWQTLYDLGLAFGWRPAGTLPVTRGYQNREYPPDDDRETPREDYFDNDYQRVTTADSLAWCAALERALAAIEGTGRMTSEEAEALRRIWAGENEDKTPMTSIFDRLAASKEFHDMHDDDAPPPTPEQLEARRQGALEGPIDLKSLICEFVEWVKPRHGFAIG